MKVLLTLTNTQALNLYNYLQNIQPGLDRVKNRVRWNFLEVIEESVFSWEKWVNEKRDEGLKLNYEAEAEKDSIKKAAMQLNTLNLVKNINDEIEKKGKESKIFTFNDREVFSEAKSLFESAGKDLVGQSSKVYSEIEDALALAKYVDDKKKPN